MRADWCGKRHQNDTTTPQGPYTLTASTLIRVRKILADNEYRGALHRLEFAAATAFLADFDLSASDKALRDLAKTKAKAANRLITFYRNSPNSLLANISDLAEPYGIALPTDDDPFIAAFKMSESAWWTSKFRRLQRQHHDTIARDINLVSSKTDSYTGRQSMALFCDHRKRTEQYLERTELQNSRGERISLKEISEHNISNPTVRRAEMMVRIKGFEQVSQMYGHTAQFITLTLPSRFHATIAKTGRPNPKYDGSTTADGQAWLVKKWALIRAKLGRLGITRYGFRVTEPHHDGTPHWHLLLFTPAHQAKKLGNTIKKYMQVENEKGAEERRVKIETIDPEKGSAIGYIAKYISKNIDGKHIETDLDGKPGEESALRIRAWASTWDIRQFQQIGGPSVSVWRELRKLNAEDGEPIALTEARSAADAGDWAAFVIAMGGIGCPRKEQLLSLHHEYNEKVDTRTGEVLLDDQAWHGGKKSAPIKGLRLADIVIITRKERWTTVPIGDCEREVDPQGLPLASSQSGAQHRPLDLCK